MTRSFLFHDPRHQGGPRVLFLVFVFLWIAANIVLRWLNWPLFHGHGAYGWPQPSVTELMLLVSVSVAPAALLLLLLGWAVRRLQTALALMVMAGVVWGLLLVVELDMSWYAMAKSHITWRDVHMFLTEPWEEHFGIRAADIARFTLLMAVHAVVLALAAWVAWRWGGRMAVGGRHGARLVGLGALVLLFSGQAAALWRAEEGDRDQWVSVMDANPLAPGMWRALADSPWLRDPALDTVEAALAGRAPELSLAASASPRTPEVSRDLLLLVVEGWNWRLFDEHTMPFTWALRSRCRYSAEHYATGNSTHYGVLGLLFGDVPYFYRGPETEGVSGSPFVDALNAAGYRTGRIGADLTLHRNLGFYLDNFSEPAVEEPDDWKNLDTAVAALARPGGDFVYLHYGKTHFPYRHDPRFTVFEPEVPEDFDYFSSRLQGLREAVVNRYRNTLRELDAWIERLFEHLPEETVVVITGDHGEEMFEFGRLGHSSALNEAQTRTPWLLCGAGVEVGEWSAVTSHADVMPTLFATLGMAQPAGVRLGRDLWHRPAGSAVIAFNNHTRPPRRFRVVGDGAWLELKAHDGGLRVWRVGPSSEAVLAAAPLLDGAAALRRLWAAAQRR